MRHNPLCGVWCQDPDTFAGAQTVPAAEPGAATPPAANRFTTVEELAGLTVGVHSETSFTKALADFYDATYTHAIVTIGGQYWITPMIYARGWATLSIRCW